MERENLFFFETKGFSMWPFIRQGEKLIFKRAPLEDLKVGDIILYRANDNLVCHRLVKKVKDKQGYLIYSRGDNSRFLTELVREELFLGKGIAILRNNKMVSITGLRQQFFNRVIVMAAPFFSMLIKVAKVLFRK